MFKIINIFKVVKYCLILFIFISCVQNAQDEWNILNNETIELLNKGKYDSAKVLAQQAIKLAEKTFGSDHPNVAKSINNLGTVYHKQKKYVP